MSGVPLAAAKVLARQRVSLAVLKDNPVEWAVACLAKEKVTLSLREWQQLAFVATGTVPLSPQSPSELEAGKPSSN